MFPIGSKQTSQECFVNRKPRFAPIYELEPLHRFAGLSLLKRTLPHTGLRYVLLKNTGMQWPKSTSNIPEVNTLEECNDLLRRDLVVLFKHSPTCPVSWMAHREMMQFRASQPDVPLFLVSVRRHREIARHIAASTGVEHASPQILVLRRGQVLGAASHDDVTAGLLQSLLAGGTEESTPQSAA